MIYSSCSPDHIVRDIHPQLAYILNKMSRSHIHGCALAMSTLVMVTLFPGLKGSVVLYSVLPAAVIMVLNLLEFLLITVPQRFALLNAVMDLAELQVFAVKGQLTTLEDILASARVELSNSKILTQELQTSLDAATARVSQVEIKAKQDLVEVETAWAAKAFSQVLNLEIPHVAMMTSKNLELSNLRAELMSAKDRERDLKLNISQLTKQSDSDRLAFSEQISNLTDQRGHLEIQLLDVTSKLDECIKNAQEDQAATAIQMSHLQEERAELEAEVAAAADLNEQLVLKLGEVEQVSDLIKTSRSN